MGRTAFTFHLFIVVCTYIFASRLTYQNCKALLFRLEGEGEGEAPLDDIFLIVFQKQREVHQDP